MQTLDIDWKQTKGNQRWQRQLIALGQGGVGGSHSRKHSVAKEEEQMGESRACILFSLSADGTAEARIAKDEAEKMMGGICEFA